MIKQVQWQFGSITFDAASGTLEDGDLRTVLPALPAALLIALIEARGEVVCRDSLCAKLWPHTIVEYDQNLNTAIKELRRALSDDARAPRYIETVPKRGYRLIPPIKHVLSAKNSRGRRQFALTAALLVATVIPGALFFTNRATSPPLPTRLVVLPVQTSAGDPLNGVLTNFESTLRQAITLNSADNTAVIGPSFSAAIGANTVSSNDTNADLFVSVVIDPQGPLHTATVTAWDADSVQWTVRHEGLVLADEVDAAMYAHRVASEIVENIIVQDGIALKSKSNSLSIPDRRTLLEAKHFLSTSQHEKALALLLTLTTHSTDAEVFVTLGQVQRSIAQADNTSLEMAKETFLNALSLEPENVNAALALGDTAFYDEAHWHEALKWYRQAASHAEYRGDVHYKLSWCLSALGRHEEAIQHAQGALALDPVSTQLLGDTAWIYFFARRYDEAIDRATRSLEYDTNNISALSCLLDAYVQIDEYELAVQTATALVKAASKTTTIPDSVGLQDPDAQIAIETFRAWLATSGGVQSPSAMRAVQFAKVGDVEQVCKMLDDAIDQRQYWGLISLAVDPRFDTMRDDPRFQAILKKIRHL